MLSGRGASTEYILDFLAIVAEEIHTSDLIGSSKLVQMCLQVLFPINLFQVANTSIVIRRYTFSYSSLDFLHHTNERVAV